jgi:hypothetical protein
MGPLEGLEHGEPMEEVLLVLRRGELRQGYFVTLPLGQENLWEGEEDTE